MNHPHNRAERRHNGEVWRNRQRFKMTQTWFAGIQRRFNAGEEEVADYWKNNNMWWARKQSSGHGNRCCCHYEKTSRSHIRKRRLAMDQEVVNNVQSFDEVYQEPKAHAKRRCQLP